MTERLDFDAARDAADLLLDPGAIQTERVRNLAGCFLALLKRVEEHEAANKPDGPDIVVTNHARQRACQRYGRYCADSLETIAASAKRLNKTRQRLQFYRGEFWGERVFLLVLEKHATSMGGLYELEVITVLTADQAAKHGVK